MIATLALFAGRANAADFAMPIKAPPLAPVFSWTGFYIGADAGYAWGDDTTTEYLTANNIYTGFRPNYKINSAVGGLYAGYNYQIGAALLGLESDIDATDIHGGFNDPLVGGAGTTRIDWQGSFRGRLGFVVDKALFYGTGGLAFGDVAHTYTNLVSGVAETTSGLSTGWTAGAGVEFAMTSNLLARVEYRYTDYGSTRYDSVTAFPGFTGVQEPRFSTARAGIAYKF